MYGRERWRWAVAGTIMALVTACVAWWASPEQPGWVARESAGRPMPVEERREERTAPPRSAGAEPELPQRPDPEEEPEAAPTVPVPAPVPARVPPEDDEEAPWPLDKDGIQGAMQAHLEEIRECYEGWLLDVPDLSGKMIVQIELTGAEGDERAKVAEAYVDSDLEHEAMDACVLNVVEGIPFDPPPGGKLSFSYPFVFDVVTGP